MEPGTVVWRETAQSLLRQKWLVLACIVLGLLGASPFALSQTTRWTAPRQLVIGPAVPPAPGGELSTRLDKTGPPRMGPPGQTQAPGRGRPPPAAPRGKSPR